MTAEAVEALSKSVLTMDTARRVGWAKAYAAQSNAEDLSRQVNIAEDERSIHRRYSSFVTGYLVRYAQEPLSPMTPEWVSEVLTHRDVVLDSDEMDRGRRAAEDSLQQWTANAEVRQARREERLAAAKESERLFANARKKERLMLARRYGFTHDRDFIAGCDAAFGRVDVAATA